MRRSMRKFISPRQLRRNDRAARLQERQIAWAKLLNLGHDDKAASEMIDYARMSNTKLLRGKHVPGLPFGGNIMRLRAAKMQEASK